MLTLAICTAYLACSVLTYGMMFAFFCGQSPCLRGDREAVEHKGMAAGIAFFGPLGLAMAFCLSGFCHHGLRFRAPKE